MLAVDNTQIISNLSYYTYQRSNWREEISRTSYLDIYEEQQKYLAINHSTGAFQTYLNNREVIEAYHAIINKWDDEHIEKENKIKKEYAEKIEVEKDEFRRIAPKSWETAYPTAYKIAEDEFENKKRVLEQKLYAYLVSMKQDYEKRKLDGILAYLKTLDDRKHRALHSYLQQKEAIEAYLLHKDIKTFLDNFENRQKVVWCLALLYGLLQGWGMAGFALSMVKNAELGAEAEWAIALVIATPVTIVNMWLVRPDLENYIGFEKYKDLLNGKISRKAVAITAASSLLYGSIVAFGITNSFDSDDARLLGPVFGLITGVLCLAEGLLSVGSLDEILKTSFSEKLKILRNEYKDDVDCEAKQRKATMAFYGVFITSCIGIVGIALVGSKTLSNQILGDDNPFNLSLSCLFLLAAACAQLPFYQDRAARLARRWVPTDRGREEEVQQDKLVFNPQNKASHYTQQGLWVVNGLFNAPAAYLGVVTVLGKFLGLHKTKGMLDENGNTSVFDSQSTFGQIFFQYGNSMEANIVYGIATMFFLTAVGISMSANCVKPQVMADPKKEIEMKRLGARA